jgi:hypothetical protein
MEFASTLSFSMLVDCKSSSNYDPRTIRHDIGLESGNNWQTTVHSQLVDSIQLASGQM